MRMTSSPFGFFSAFTMRVSILLLFACCPPALLASETTDVEDARSRLPNIVVLLADNLGWANVGYHRPPSLPRSEISTPNIDRLVKEGVELDRHYTYKFCSPSRSSFLTGRLPFHVNVYNDDPARPEQGVPWEMTMLPAKLKEKNYRTAFFGKWHVSMASMSKSIPLARGFDYSLGYFHSTNNYYDSRRAQGCKNVPAVDLWENAGPATSLNGTAYEERIFGRRAEEWIRNHTKQREYASQPLFMYYAFHTSCVGWNATGNAGRPGDSLQPDPEYYAKFRHIEDPDRRANVAMVALMDDIVGNITRTLKDEGLWKHTLLLWSSDNGGAVHLGGGANVFPLRGGYYNNWEGGIRAAALLAGGALPKHVRGTKLEGFIHEADWYATFLNLVDVDPTDARAAAAGLPPVDSLDVWDLITGANATSPRFEWPITPFGEEAGDRAPHGGDAAYMAEGRYKLLVGNISQSGWCGEIHPNLTRPWDSFADVADCSVRHDVGKIGCLFDVLNDPGERHDLAMEMPEKAKEIYEKMIDAEKDWFDPDRGEPDLRACEVAKRTGFWGPFLP